MPSFAVVIPLAQSRWQSATTHTLTAAKTAGAASAAAATVFIMDHELLLSTSMPQLMSQLPDYVTSAVALVMLTGLCLATALNLLQTASKPSQHALVFRSANSA